MDWKLVEHILQELTEVYAQDNLRKITFDAKIFPLILRFSNEDRSEDLFDSVLSAAKSLLADIHQ